MQSTCHTNRYICHSPHPIGSGLAADVIGSAGLSFPSDSLPVLARQEAYGIPSEFWGGESLSGYVIDVSGLT